MSNRLSPCAAPRALHFLEAGLRERWALAIVALLVCGCVPVRQTYYEAVGGSVTGHRSTSKCKPDHFTVGEKPGTSLVLYASPEDAGPTVTIELYAGHSDRVDFEPREIDVQSVEKPELHATYPLKFSVRCNPERSARLCDPTEVIEPPMRWQADHLPWMLVFQETLPTDYRSGFTIRLPKMTDGSSGTDAQIVTFRSVTEVVSTGPLGCLGP